MPWDRKGTAPIIHVGIHTYSSLNALYKRRTRLCAGVKDKKPAPLLAPSGDSRSKKTPLHVDAPPAGPLHPQRVWYNVRSTSSCRRRPPHSYRHRALSPTKSALKMMNLALATETDALSALNADLQSTIDGKVCTYVVPCFIHWYPLIGFFLGLFLDFSVFVV